MYVYLEMQLINNKDMRKTVPIIFDLEVHFFRFLASQKFLIKEILIIIILYNKETRIQIGNKEAKSSLKG